MNNTHFLIWRFPDPTLILDQLGLTWAKERTLNLDPWKLHYRPRQDSWVILDVLYKEVYAGTPIHNPILDIGAHIGTFALWVLTQNNHANITCFEPDDENFRYLVLNTHEYPTVRCEKRALTTKRFVYLNDDPQKACTHEVAHSQRPTLGFRLEKYATDPCTIKCDAEGGEKYFLTEPIPQGVTYIVLEQHDAYVNHQRLTDAIRRQGFHLLKSVRGPGSAIMHFRRHT